MTSHKTHLHLGLGACFVALFLLVVGIPQWVSSPSNVSNIVLAPTFWPYVLSGFTGLTGLGLLGSWWRSRDGGKEQTYADVPAWRRIALLGIMMIMTMYALPRIGMVWTSMVLFAGSAFLFQTRHPRVAVICALLVPLGLYAFFAHVAGVAIPQGDFVRLP